jgi:dolichol-phosphate mannosyltransferase
LLEIASGYSISTYVHAGSSSEYGLNSAAPEEDDILLPNSHYSVTKASAAQMIKYYGLVKGMSIVNLRYYSIYGPYEEPDRLIPMLIDKGMQSDYPILVQPDISRDFLFIDDALYATLLCANNINILSGNSLNIGSGVKTTIRDIVSLIRDIFSIKKDPVWGEMLNRQWDLTEWYGNIEKAKKLIQWECHTSLREGLYKTYEWQKNYSKPLYEKKISQDKIRHKISAVIAQNPFPLLALEYI